MSIYRSAIRKQQMMEIYEQNLARWTIPYESVYVDTLFGRTHLLVSGPKEAVPLILIHGLSMTSAMWMPNIASFSQHYRCFAIDIIGDYGKSELSHIGYYPRVGKDYSTWLRQVYEEVGITDAHMLGLSHGGFVAINHAIFAPEQIRKLILLAPSGLDLTLKKVLPKIFHYLLFPTKKNRESLVHWFIGDHPLLLESFYDQLNLGLQGRPKVPIPILVSGRKLRRITQPVMLLLGEIDETTSAEKVKNRVKKFIPASRIEIIPGVGHGMNYEAAERVNELVLEFLGQ